MRTPLEAAMARATDEALYEILHLNRAEYSAEAIAVAEEELRRRNLTSEQTEEFRIGIERRLARAEEPLSPAGKILLFLCGLTCFGIPLAIVVGFAFRGADRKYREGWRCIRYGVAVAIIALVVYYAVIIAVLCISSR
jgi:hypothetical protein